MNTAIKLPIQALNPVMIRDLQDKYPSAVVSIEVADTATPPMDEEQFWSIISRLDWGRKSLQDILSPAIDALSQFSIHDIAHFDQILAEKLYALDAENFAIPLGWGASAQDAFFSPDAFLYARCCAVANGKAFYEKVLTNPQYMPKEYSFEPILYLAEKAYAKKTGTDQYDYLASVSYETFSNAEGWHDGPPIAPIRKS